MKVSIEKPRCIKRKLNEINQFAEAIPFTAKEFLLSFSIYDAFWCSSLIKFKLKLKRFADVREYMVNTENRIHRSTEQMFEVFVNTLHVSYKIQEHHFGWILLLGCCAELNRFEHLEFGDIVTGIIMIIFILQTH